jgi:hypothetical protein
MDTKTALRYALEYLEKAHCDGFLEDCVIPLSKILPKLQAVYDLEIDKAERAAEQEDIPDKISQRYEAIGWTYSYCFSLLDDGIDPRKIEIPVLLEKAKKQLGEY